MKQLKFIGSHLKKKKFIDFFFSRDEIEKKILKYKDDYYKEQDFGVFGNSNLFNFF